MLVRLWREANPPTTVGGNAMTIYHTYLTNQALAWTLASSNSLSSIHSVLFPSWKALSCVLCEGLGTSTTPLSLCERADSCPLFRSHLKCSSSERKQSFSAVSVGSAQFSSLAQSCPTLCVSMNRSMPASLSISSQSPPQTMSIELVMPSSHLILSRPQLVSCCHFSPYF